MQRISHVAQNYDHITPLHYGLLHHHVRDGWSGGMPGRDGIVMAREGHHMALLLGAHRWRKWSLPDGAQTGGASTMHKGCDCKGTQM